MSALGQLLGGMGGGAAPEGDPEALLQQILDLMGQYLALGPETPAYQTISEALPAIEESMGAGGEMGGAQPPGETGAPPVMPEGGENSPEEPMMPSSPPSGFDEASAMALEDMKKRKPKAY